MNNAPDYEDNLAFEPKMTWEELIDKWSIYYNKDEETIRVPADDFMNANDGYFDFDKDGNITAGTLAYDADSGCNYWQEVTIYATGLTPEQINKIVVSVDERIGD